MFFTRLIDSDDPKALKEALHWLYGFVRPQRLAILGLLGLALCASLLALAQPWLTKLLIDDGLLARDFPLLALLAGVMIVVGLVGTVLSGLNRYLHTRLSGRILFALRDALYRHLQSLSPTFFARRRIGDLMSRLDGDVAEIQRFSLDALVRRLRLSPRYVQDLLHETGDTFTGRVLEMRLQKARRMLADPGCDGMTIGDIAALCGFGEAAYFTRRFRRRFEMSPTTFRACRA